MRRNGKKILIRAAILVPMLIALSIVVKPMVAKAWSWYNPFSWPVWDNIYYFVHDIFWDPEEGCEANDVLVARVMVDGEDEVRDFYTEPAIAWNYTVARALAGKKVVMKLESDWDAKMSEMRTQYPQLMEGCHDKDREWLTLYKYDMGAEMEYRDVPYLSTSSTSDVDCFRDGAIFIPKGCDITLDINGHKIDRQADYEYIADGEVFYVSENAKFMIVDSNSDEYRNWKSIGTEGGCIRGGSSSNGAGGIHIKDGASVYIEKGNFLENSSSNDGGAIKIDGENAKLFIDGTDFVENHATDAVIERNYGGAIACYDAKMEIRNASFMNNEADNRGGGIYNDSGGLELVNCTFRGNTASIDYGGGIYLDTSQIDPRILLEDNTFVYNKAGKDGGGLYLDTDSRTDVFRTKITNNGANRYGGGLYLNGRGCCFCDAEISNNNAKKNGGGVFVYMLRKFNVTGKIRVTDNKSQRTANSKTRVAAYTTDNVCLETGTGTNRNIQAKINNGGLSVGSKIGVNSDVLDLDRTGKDIVYNITTYAKNKYFSLDDPKNTQFRFDTKSTETAFYMASLISENTIVLIILVSVALVMIVITVIVYRRTRKGVAHEKEKNE